MKRQFESGNLTKIRPDFQPSEVLFYQFPYCFQNNGPDQNSFETIENVKNDLSSIVSEDCSILFSCGSMGLSIADYFFNRNVNVFYCGGGLQIFFGIMGERWRARDIKSDDIFLGTYLTNPEAWISEIPEEFKPENSKSIENGCYW
jgi:hypothetical protein